MVINMAKGNNYFEFFIELVDYCLAAAENLSETLHNFDAEKLPETMEFLHEIEHNADVKKHEMIKKLSSEFITPIEREDIILLSQEIDDVTDSIEDVLLKIYMFNITSIKEEALEFCKIIADCCRALKKVMENFQNFRKSTELKNHLIEINRLEEVGDKLYTEAVRTLYTTCKDPIEIIAWTETFRRFEQCCDNCEDIADVVEGVIMKNS